MVKKNLDKSKKLLLTSMMYHEIYNSGACWKVDSKIVTANIRKLELEAIKGKH